MRSLVRPEVFERASRAAQQLKWWLETRLIGLVGPDPIRTCANSPIGPSRVVAITIPSTYKHQIAKALSWRCKMMDPFGRTWSLGLSEFFPWCDLLTLFRNHFAAIDVEVNHPDASLYHDKDTTGDPAVNSGRTFTPSGSTVVVSNESPVYVRPLGDTTNSVWLNAEIRFSDNRTSCYVDPLAFRFDQPENPRYKARPSDLPTFYVRVPAPNHGSYLHFPLARVVSVSDANEAVIELDRSVEQFQPTSS